MIDTEISISDSDLAAYENGRFMVRQSGLLMMGHWFQHP